MVTPAANCLYRDGVVQGGEGLIHIKGLATPDSMYNHGKVFAHIIIDPGCSIGYHTHTKETEFYYILKGEGTFNDNGEEKLVHEGDLCATGYGDGHAMANHTQEPLEMIALIIKE